MEAHLHNHSGCRLTLKDTRLTWGRWSTEPAEVIRKGQDSLFEAASPLTVYAGVEGWVAYVSSNCDDAARNQHTVTLRFEIPIDGDNNRFTADGDGVFRVEQSGGEGHHAVVGWGIRRA
ncbi:hypothetical protein [Streptomyces botrytidirepellens]|uniref:Uncharacterized protein n=1 Tax=Streptomyces botrytidirepellens TaxID=2486417 RepID=A0A3M8W522_9ACTN|nr:hypothetical protein [Streptomyces botrytidirepellens]RNG23113.1 hypothetical protein EEJ42_19055 [Streptomyces botrytidirepellens]